MTVLFIFKDRGCNAGDSLKCENGGFCESNGFCECKNGYAGKTCSKRKSPRVVANKLFNQKRIKLVLLISLKFFYSSWL